MTEQERIEKIKALVDQPFLDRLVEVAKLVALGVDYIEVVGFVQEVANDAGLREPTYGELEPYEIKP